MTAMSLLRRALPAATRASGLTGSLAPAMTQRLRAPQHMMTSRRGVYLTGNTLAASMKMRTDTSGAGYSIYWTKVGDAFVVSAQYVTPARQQELIALGKTTSYAEASGSVQLDAAGDGPVATVYKTGEPLFIPSAGEELKLKRREFAKEYGIKSICFIPFEDGVLEYGTSTGDSTATWSGMPECPTMPKKEMRAAFENIGAKYVIFWADAGDGNFKSVADYVTPERVRSLKNKRGDDKTFASESRGFKLPVDGNGPVATAARTGQEVYIADAPADATFRRKDVAKEFGVESVHFMPVNGGVLEYGTPKDTRLSGNPLAAAMKMRCDNSGACYAIYWAKYDNQYVVSGDYVTPERRDELKRAGLEGSFAEASAGVHLAADGDGPVATVGKTGKPYYIADAPNCPLLKRKDFAKKYGITSMAFVPIEGGVLEYGTATGNWGPEMPPCADMPKDELKSAFNSGAVYCIFWQRKGDFFEVAADYVLPERAFALEQKRGDKKTFASESRNFKLPADGNGYVAGAARSGAAFTVEDAKSDAKLLRHEIAKEFEIGEVRVVPCRDGVLEYGVAPTKA